MARTGIIKFAPSGQDERNEPTVREMPAPGARPAITPEFLEAEAAKVRRTPARARPASIPAVPAGDFVPRSTEEVPIDPALPAHGREASIQRNFDVAKEGSFPTNRHFKQDIERRVREAHGPGHERLQELSPENVPHIAAVGVNDARYALASNNNAIGWYDRKLKRAVSVLSLMHPEILTDPKAALAFRFGLANTSNMTKVDKNFRQNERAYDHFKRTGVFPTDQGIGKSGPTIDGTFDLFNRLLQRHPDPEELRAILDARKSVRDWNRDGFPISGELMDQIVHGSAVMGPKVGNGFYQNLGGNYDRLTMDRWNMRTWGRWIGSLIADNPELVEKNSHELQDLIREVPRGQRKAFERMIGGPFSIGDPVKTAEAIDRASADPDVRKVMSTFGHKMDDGEYIGDKLRRKGIRLTDNINGEIELPTDAQRPYIRDVYDHILRALRSGGYPDLTMADLQAAVWYPEKLLYDSAGLPAGKAKMDFGKEGPPDYEQAAVKLALERGHTREDIQNALDRSHEIDLRGSSYGPASSRRRRGR